jgi:hypothetical protein
MIASQTNTTGATAGSEYIGSDVLIFACPDRLGGLTSTGWTMASMNAYSSSTEEMPASIDIKASSGLER